MPELIVKPSFKKIVFVLVICALLPLILGGGTTYVTLKSAAGSPPDFLWLFNGILCLPLVVALVFFAAQKIVVDSEKLQIFLWFHPVKTLFFRDIRQFQYNPWFKVKHHTRIEVFKAVMHFELTTGEYIYTVMNYAASDMAQIGQQLSQYGVKVAPTPETDDAQLKVKKEQLRQALIYLGATIGFIALYLGGCIK